MTDKMKELVEPLSEMSEEQLLDKIKSVRASRKIAPKAEIKKERKKRTDEEKLLAQLRKLSPEQLAALQGE